MTRRHFETGGDAYARYRPSYPPELAAALAGLAPDRELAVDVGCGNGQLTVLLAGEFDRVQAFDVSADQVANAVRQPNIDYAVAPAESLPVTSGTASLVSAAQAAHWFDLPSFYAEVRRIARPGAVLALITYMNPVVAGPLAERFAAFYAQDVGRFWPPERPLVESGYADVHFPFEELDAPSLTIERDWALEELLGYLETWSASKRARAAGEGYLVDAFAEEARQAWGDPDTVQRVTWPVRMRLGRLAK